MASSSSNTGSDLGSSCTAKLTCPRRLPKRVPVSLRPRDGVIERLEGRESHLQVGITRLGRATTWRRERRREENREWSFPRRLKEVAGEEWRLVVTRSLLETSSVSGIIENEEEEEEEESRFKVVVLWVEGVILLVLPLLGRASCCCWWWWCFIFV
ncbi:hypothetical protein HS088_TW03G00564 [Tripterygium wilfordii]|uniref:Uncharacterized protein n=1 Tax=Tripterygium wilfordii TaxID=458696 RepID=A0A7J7DVA3_TRIWF|nr:hypothetical protein HS088_TW03G00564 [Tripterygium wilfordii]